MQLLFQDLHRVDLGKSYKVMSTKQRHKTQHQGNLSLPPLSHTHPLPPLSPGNTKRRRVEFQTTTCVIITSKRVHISIVEPAPSRPLRSILKNSCSSYQPADFNGRHTEVANDAHLKQPAVSRTSSGRSINSLQVPSFDHKPAMEAAIGFSCSKEFEAVFKNMDVDV